MGGNNKFYLLKYSLYKTMDTKRINLHLKNDDSWMKIVQKSVASIRHLTGNINLLGNRTFRRTYAKME